MMRRWLLALAVCVALAVTAPQAAGTVTVTTTQVSTAVTKITLAWISTAGGAVSGNTFAAPRGELVQVKFVPGAAAAQPTDLYDVTLVDTDGIDLLAGSGANLSNASSSIKVPSFGTTTLYRYFHDGSQVLDLVVANAGSAKSGTVYLYFR